jgi:hypothetical protein
MIVLKFEQSARDWQCKQEKYAKMQRRKDDGCKAKERMLVSDFFFFFFSCLDKKIFAALSAK